jgi:hypothetical protein
VAHDLADPSVNAPSVSQSSGAEISLTLYAAKTSSESSSYSYTFTASMRTPGSPRFIVSAPGPQVAGTTFNVTLTASPNGIYADTTYSGTKTIVFSGPDPSPNSTPPVYPTNVTFANGVGTAPVTLYDKETTSLTATDGDRSGSSTPFSVGPALVPLSFSPCPPATTTTATTVETITRGQDPYGNADPNAGSAVTVNLSAAGGSIQPGTVTIAANQTTSTPAATYTNPTTSGTAVTLAATAPGYASASCKLTTTGPMFLINSVSPQAAGGAFNVTLTASNDGSTTDTTYSGPKIVTFGGPANAPNGQAPSYPATVNFTNGVGTATITLFDAQTVTLSVTDGPHTGTVPVTVSPASVPLTFSACPPANTSAKATNSETISRAATDAYSNPDPNRSSNVTVSLSATAPTGSAGSFSPNQVSIPANQSTSGATTYSNPNQSGVAVTMTGQASGSGYANATCAFTSS